MAIAPTGAMYKTLTFDGKTSSSFGVYITGEAVFNAPERDVEMIDIPGRNGSFVLDNGRFQNIEVSYPAGIFADSEADFAEAISEFRNWLCSRKGYVRLSDDYNPNEYRLAVYKAGLEVSPAQLKAGEFTITFDCKPQRFLTSGETAVAVTNGGTVTNPTLFESSPVLQIWGYGKFGINDDELEIISKPIGKVKVADQKSSYTASVATVFPTQYANSGNEITGILNGGRCTTAHYFTIDCGTDSVKSVSVSGTSGWTTDAYTSGPNKVIVALYCLIGEYYGSADSESYTFPVTITLTDNTTKTANVTATASYNGSDTITASQSIGTFPAGYTLENQMSVVCELWLNSSQSALGSPLYFDLDIGEAYKIENDEIFSVNNAVTIPGELPTLPPGTNTFTYDNTITQLKVTPRWWKL